MSSLSTRFWWPLGCLSEWLCYACGSNHAPANDRLPISPVLAPGIHWRNLRDHTTRIHHVQSWINDVAAGRYVDGDFSSTVARVHCRFYRCNWTWMVGLTHKLLWVVGRSNICSELTLENFDYCGVVDVLLQGEHPGLKLDEATAAIIGITWIVVATGTFGIGA